MRISTRLALAAAVPAVMALIVVAGFFGASKYVTELQRHRAAALEIREAVDALNAAGTEYVLVYDAAAKQRFAQRSESTHRAVNAELAHKTAHRPLLLAISRDIDSMQVTADHISALEGGVSTSGLAVESEERRLSTEFLTHANRASKAANSLSDLAASDALAQQQSFQSLIAVAVILAAAVLTGGLLGLMRSISGGLSSLRQGAEVVGEGDLEYRIGLRGRDEIGDLGRAFDRMTESLQTITKSSGVLGQLVEEHKRAQDEATQQLETTTLLLQAAEALSNRSELEDVLQTLADVAVLSTGRGRCIVCLVKPDGASVYLAASRGVRAPTKGSVFKLDELSPIVRELLVSGGTRIRKPEDQRGGFADATGMLNALFVAIGRRGTVLGFMSLDDPDALVDFRPRDIDLMQGLASQAAISIENARLFETERLGAKVSSKLAEISGVLAATKDLDSDMPQIMQSACELLEATGSIYSERVEGGWHKVWVYGPATDGFADFYRDDQSPGRMIAFETRKPYMVSDVLTEPGVDKALARKNRYRSYIVYPLLFREEIVATLSLIFTEPNRTLSPIESNFMDRLSFLVSVNLENLRLFELEQRRRSRIEALHQVTEVAVSALGPQEVGQSVLEYLVDRHGFEMASVWMTRSDDLAVIADVNQPPRPRASRRMPITSDYAAALVFRSAEPMISENTSRLRDDTPPMDPLGGHVGAYAILPLRSRGRTVGTFHFGWKKPREISQDDLEFYSSLGNEMGVILENARLYETEHDIAERLQSALLALPESMRGIDFAHAYHSASESARVGGDFYDLFEIDDDLIGISIGDVAGKGLNAAVLTSLVKNTIRAHATERGSTPARILKLTNEVVYRATPTESFVTVFLAILDRRDGRLLYANAGHTTAAVTRGLSADRLRSTGPILGAFSEVEFDEGEVCSLEPDQMLVLYTDGLIEARRGREFYGEQRLFDLLGGTTGVDPIDIVELVIEDALDFTRMKLNDDLAILAVRRLEPDETVPRQQRLEI
jgi:GAF domain-containing protein/HAMP domain-containing protein